MTTYQQAGVNIEKGDTASFIAFLLARKTFECRKDMIGQPVILKNGYAGVLDMGDFYLVQNDDGVGTKMKVAQSLSKYDTIGIDLLAMVLDDALCLGAEVISVTNTIDTEKVDPQIISKLMNGLQAEACRHNVILPGGEIAELKDMARGYIWNATAVGIVEKHKLITGKTIKAGDPVVAIRGKGLRSNGLTLACYILEKEYGATWALKKYDEKKNWGEILLTPSTIFHSILLELHGRYQQKQKAEIKGVAHITGSGIPGNLPRILPKGLGARLENLFPPDDCILKLQEIGQVTDKEAYWTWNMGNPMLVVLDDVDALITTMKKHHIEARVAGKITDKDTIELISQGFHKNQQLLTFQI